ncbi:MAG: pyridoxamine 5'-phosphate oxidase family protein [Gammaproteobacteria bacterium]
MAQWPKSLFLRQVSDTVNQDNDHEKIRQEFQALRDSLKTVQLATIDSDGNPQASYAPCVWIENDCYLYLSELARHTQNLIANPAISLLLIESEEKSKNLFSRRRIMLQGEVSTIGRDSNQFAIIMAEFKSRFGDFIDVIEPLQDFHLFQINPQSGRFIRGFAQAYDLVGPGLREFKHIDMQSR